MSVETSQGDGLKEFVVGTFCEFGARGTPRIMAYTMWYSPQWAGCIEYTVRARNGTHAKKLATAMRKAFETQQQASPLEKS